MTQAPDKTSVSSVPVEAITQTVVTNAEALRKELCRPGRTEYRPLGTLLVEHGLITEEQLLEALQRKNTDMAGQRLGDILRNLGYASTEAIYQTMAEKLAVPLVRLADFDIEPGVIGLIPVDLARSRVLMPLMHCGKKLVVALEDPFDPETLDLLHFVTGVPLDVCLASREDIEHAISHYYGPSDVADVMEDMSAPVTEEEVTVEDVMRMGQERPVVRFVQNVIVDAANSRASDIHIRPREKGVDLFFRIDGTLIHIRSFNKSLLPAVVSRIKIVGGMDIAEHRVPQDGRYRVLRNGKEIDLRISVLPSIYGESVVIRILDTSEGLRTLDQIGFSGEDAERFVDMLMHSSGIILVTGPTGSGKSTTLYAALQKLRETNVNIITVEDPVEYRLDGIVQIQVRQVTGYTFARALRHILRHDPDVIMVGEIRDQETAKMAVESSLTGHIVLSTLHTNSAATTVTRLLEIGIEPYLVNTSLLGVLAQRLVRKNCEHCKTEEQVPDLARRMLNVSGDEVFWKGQGCDHCHGTGYRGRMAVYELLRVTPDLRKTIVEAPSAEAIEQQAQADGMMPLTQQALNVAREGLTSLEEVYRIRLE